MCQKKEEKTSPIPWQIPSRPHRFKVEGKQKASWIPYRVCFATLFGSLSCFVLLLLLLLQLSTRRFTLRAWRATGNGQRAACVWRRARWAQANVELVAVSWRGCQPFLAKHFRWIPAIFCLHFVNPKTQNRKTKNPMPKPTPNGSQAGLNSKLKGIRFSLW